MAAIGTISAALQLVDGKKENLRKAFEDLQSQSHSLSSFNLTWSDLDSHFSSLQSSLNQKFQLLQSIDPQSQPNSLNQQSSSSSTVPARPELKSLCEKMDGEGLLQYLIIGHRTDREPMKAELPDAYKYSPDAALMVLDAMEKVLLNGKDLDFRDFRINCVSMLESLMFIKAKVSDDVRDKAMKLALQWKDSMASLDKRDKTFAVLGFLYLVAVYNLSDFDMDELVGYVVEIAKRAEAVDLCRAIIPDDRISDLIQKVIDDGKKLLAVKFSYEFKKTDKFPLVPLLKEYRQECSKLTKAVLNNPKSNQQAVNGATMKEIASLKSIIKCVEDYHLESEYPTHNLVSQIGRLEKDKANKKRPAAVSVPKSEKAKTNKQPRTAAPAGQEITPKSNSNVFPIQQPQVQVQAAGLLPDLGTQYMNQAGPYAVAGVSHAAPYAGPNAVPYGYIGGPGFNGNLTSSGPNLHPSGLQTPSSGYYEMPVPNGGYNLLPQYHPPYYPQ